MKNSILFLSVLAAFFFAGCTDKSSTGEADTPTSGKVNISIDENIAPLTDELIDAFEHSYPDAFLVQRYHPESDVLHDLLNDSSELAVMTRTLKTDELKYFAAKRFSVEQIKIASDAVVLIESRDNPDSVFTVAAIKKILSGEDTLWSQLNPALKNEKIILVFDNTSSSNLRYLCDTLLNGNSPGKNCYALHSNDSVLNYVSRTPGAIGVVGLNWIGEKNSTDDRMRLSMVKMTMIGRDSATAVHPYLGNLSLGQYPFMRGVWIVRTTSRSGLGTGFASFSLGDRGQLIVQHAGLLPAKPAERKIEIQNE